MKKKDDFVSKVLNLNYKYLLRSIRRSDRRSFQKTENARIVGFSLVNDVDDVLVLGTGHKRVAFYNPVEGNPWMRYLFTTMSCPRSKIMPYMRDGKILVVEKDDFYFGSAFKTVSDMVSMAVLLYIFIDENETIDWDHSIDWDDFPANIRNSIRNSGGQIRYNSTMWHRFLKCYANGDTILSSLKKKYVDDLVESNFRRNPNYKEIRATMLIKDISSDIRSSLDREFPNHVATNEFTESCIEDLMKAFVIANLVEVEINRAAGILAEYEMIEHNRSKHDMFKAYLRHICESSIPTTVITEELLQNLGLDVTNHATCQRILHEPGYIQRLGINYDLE